MRLLVILMAAAVLPVTAQAQSSPMFLAINDAMHRICAVNRDARQCEIAQDLFFDQLAIDQGRIAQPRPLISPAEKAAVRAGIAKEAAKENGGQPLSEASMRTIEAAMMKEYRAQRRMGQ